MVERTARWNGWNPSAEVGKTPGEWPALYAQYLLRAASQSTRTSELYQSVLNCVAQGELAPTVFQDMLPAFIQAWGPAYTSKLADITSRFFTGMVQVDATASQELADILLGEAPAHPEPVPDFDASDPIRWYQRLTEYAGQLSTNALATYQTLLERVAAGEIMPDRVQEASSSYVQRRLPEYLNRLGSLYFDLLNGLSDLRAGYEADFLAEVLATAKLPGQEAPAALNLAAPLGSTTSASLLLTNTRSAPAIIHCGVTDVRRADGIGPAFAPKVIVTPDVLKIPPGGQMTLVLSLRLDDHVYDPDVLYIGTVHIERDGEPRLDIPLRITATPAAPAAATSGKPKTTQRVTAGRKTAKRKAGTSKP